MKNQLLPLVSVFVIACGGGSGGGGGNSGLADGKRLAELNSAEVMDLCEFALDVSGPQRSVLCGDTIVLVGAGTVSECVEDISAQIATAPACPATVGEYEACIIAMDERSDPQICDLFIPQACAPLLAETCNP